MSTESKTEKRPGIQERGCRGMACSLRLAPAGDGGEERRGPQAMTMKMSVGKKQGTSSRDIGWGLTVLRLRGPLGEAQSVSNRGHLQGRKSGMGGGG